MSKEYCIARHDDKVCFLLNCRYHILVIGNIKVLLQKVEKISFNYPYVDCLYTLVKYRFTCKIFVESGQLFDKVQRAIHFNHQKRGVDRKPRLLREK